MSDCKYIRTHSFSVGAIMVLLGALFSLFITVINWVAVPIQGKPGASQNYEVSLKGDLAMIDNPKGSASRPKSIRVINLRRKLIPVMVALGIGLVGAVATAAVA